MNHALKEMSTEAAFMFESTIEKAQSRRHGGKFEAYFNQQAALSFEIMEDGIIHMREAKKKAQKIKGGPTAPFFTKLYGPLEIGDEGTETAVENKEEIWRIMLALLQVGHETAPGAVLNELDLGNITDFTKPDLEKAYIIYEEIIKLDLENNVVPVGILKMAKDPASALVNIVERTTFEDTKALKNGKINELIHDVMISQAKDPFDQQTAKMLAMHKALSEKHTSII